MIPQMPYRKILETLEHGVAVISPHYEILYVNNGFCHIYGINEEEALRSRCYEVFHSEGAPCSSCKLQKVFRGENLNYIHHHYNAEGQTLACEVKAVPFEADGGTYVAHLSRDVTPDYKNKEELKQAINARELILDILHHDVTNVAGIAYGNLELFNLAYNHENENLDNALYSLKRLFHIIDTAIKCVRLEETDRVPKEELSLSSLARETYRLLETEFRKKKIEVLLPEGEVRARASNTMEDVFLNLLHNALKYSPPESRVEVNIEKSKEGVTIEVADQGAGIGDTYKDKIFNRYMRRENRVVEGRGLGLSIVRRIAELHHGRVWVEDNQPQGSVFKFFLPQ